jgi:hypothetical protein
MNNSDLISVTVTDPETMAIDSRDTDVRNVLERIDSGRPLKNGTEWLKELFDKYIGTNPQVPQR